jgi:hypothetical protein
MPGASAGAAAQRPRQRDRQQRGGGHRQHRRDPAGAVDDRLHQRREHELAE